MLPASAERQGAYLEPQARLLDHLRARTETADQAVVVRKFGIILFCRFHHPRRQSFPRHTKTSVLNQKKKRILAYKILLRADMYSEFLKEYQLVMHRV